ncbi:MAG: right-handed parallel beta-helix repeat-containing protein [Methanoculleus sp.]|nr:right-handed parallel beta-helix repeat-containing protein [Methanoculleus sp.]HOI57106.1 right-handed parallel beta-helix repeat-containing protein [Methanoculleus sp.]
MIQSAINMGILVLLAIFMSTMVILTFMQENSEPVAPVSTSNTILVTAHDSPEELKVLADYICDGTADQVEIQRALNALGSAGGTVTLTEGTFQLDSNLNIPSNVVLEGQGPDATWLSWSSGRIMCEAQQNVVLRDFKTTGTGAIFLYNSDHVKVHNVTATVDNSFYGGAFFLYVGNDVMEDIEFVNCKAIDCGRHGWQSAGEGSPRVIRNIRYIDCEAINCGRYSQYSPHGQWTCGFQLAENADVEDCQVIRCYAEGNLEAGFIVEAAPKKTRFVLQDCVSKNNGQKPDDYYNGPDEGMSGCLFGAGFWIDGDMTLINCTAADNRKYGFAVWSSSSYTSLYNSTDAGSEIGHQPDRTDDVYRPLEGSHGIPVESGYQMQRKTSTYNGTSGSRENIGLSSTDPDVHLYSCTDNRSTVGFWLVETHGVYLKDCSSLNARAYAIYALEAEGVTMENLCMTYPAGVNGNGTFFGTLAHPVLNSQFDIIGQNSADVRTVYGEGGRGLTFTGVIRTDHPEPVVIRGGSDVDTSGLRILTGTEDSYWP